MAIGYHIYQGGSLVATVSGTTWTSAPLPGGSSTTFLVRAYDSTTGLEELNTDASATVALDSGGNDVSGVPFAPTALAARPTANAGVRVSWSYPSQGRTRRPTGFRVYRGTGGTVNYASPVATVPYNGGRHHFADLGGMTSGVAYTFGVRAYNGSGTESNTATATATADATPPASVDSLTSAPS